MAKIKVKINFTTVNHEPRKKLGLSMNEYAVADLIYNLSANPINGGWCYATKDTLADILDLSRQSVHAMLKKLIAKKLVTKDEVTKQLRTTSYWYNNVIVGYSKESLQGVKKVYTKGAEDSKESLHPIYDNNKDNKNTNTNVLGKQVVSRVDNRNVDITQGINLLEELFGHKPQKETLNRFALKRLYAKFGKDITLRAMRFAKQVRGEDRYAPGIYNYLDLEGKWDQLVDYGKEKAKSVPQAMKASDIARMMKGTNVA